MAKILLLLLALFAVYWILKSYKKKIQGGAKEPPKVSGEDMVRCAQCGVHLPRSDSLMSGEAFYCTAEHRRLHQKTE